MHARAEAAWRTATRPVGSIRAVRTDEPLVVLTFDDGPFPGTTEALLDALADHGATATFFVLLTRVRRAPALLDQIVAAGHEVGLHGPDHTRLTTLPFGDVRRRTAAARAELEELVGRPVRWFRPPYGSQSLRSWAAVRAAGLAPVVWGGTTWDWKDVPTAERLAKVTSALAPGQIVLAHDTIAGVDDGADPREPFELDRGAFLRDVLELYRDRGMAVLSLGDALARGATPVRSAWFGR